jgi:hypothetical protein
VDASDSHAGDDASGRLQYLLSVGRRYEKFSQEHPLTAAAQIAELNVPGVQDNAWDLQWLPDTLRPRITRAASALVLDFCRAPGDSYKHADLMDIIMPAAIVTACVVAHTYGVTCAVPRTSLRGHLDVFARLFHHITSDETEVLEAIAQAPGEALPRTVPLLSCVPVRVGPHLVRLAHVMARAPDPVGAKIAMTIGLIGAVAADTFESLNLKEKLISEVDSA